MNVCLLLINIQNDHFEGGKLALTGASQAALQAGEALQCFRDHHKPFMHIQMVERADPAKAFFTGTSGIQFHARVPHFENEPIAMKFENENLPVDEIAAFMTREDCAVASVCYFGESKVYEEYTKAIEAKGKSFILLSDASVFSGVPKTLGPNTTLERFFNQLQQQELNFESNLPPTMLYNAINNVQPKDK